MSTINTILNKLGKIEAIEKTNLAKHEIELGIKEDITKLNQEASKITKSVAGLIVDIDKNHDILIEQTKAYQIDKTQVEKIKKEYDSITSKFEQSLSDIKNNIFNSDAKIKNVKAQQNLINNIISKANALKNNIEQSSKELGIDAKSSKQYVELIQTIDNLDMLLEDASQAIVSYERDINSTESLIK